MLEDGAHLLQHFSEVHQIFSCSEVCVPGVEMEPSSAGWEDVPAGHREFLTQIFRQMYGLRAACRDGAHCGLPCTCRTQHFQHSPGELLQLPKPSAERPQRPPRQRCRVFHAIAIVMRRDVSMSSESPDHDGPEVCGSTHAQRHSLRNTHAHPENAIAHTYHITSEDCVRGVSALGLDAWAER